MQISAFPPAISSSASVSVSRAAVVQLLTCLLMSLLNQIARPVGNNFPEYLFVS